MRFRIRFGLLMLALLASGAARAAVLPVDGTLSITIGPFGAPVFTGSSIASSSGGIGSPFTLPAGLFSVSQSVFETISPPVFDLSLIQVPASPAMPFLNAAGAFGPLPATPFGGNFGGAMGNNGFAKLWWSGTSSYSSGYGGTIVVCGPGGGVLPTDPACLGGGVPLKYVGGGGMGVAIIAGVPATQVGAVWSNLGVDATNPTKVVKIQNVAAGVPVTITATAYDKRGPGGAGRIQLVAPVNVKLNGGLLGTMPIVGVLTVQFVPEPGTLLLVGSGIVALVAFGGRRTRDRSLS